jgi:hypothetical protein
MWNMHNVKIRAFLIADFSRIVLLVTAEHHRGIVSEGTSHDIAHRHWRSRKITLRDIDKGGDFSIVLGHAWCM